MPAIHFGVALGIRALGVVPDNPLMLLVLMVEGTTPSAMSLALMTKVCSCAWQWRRQRRALTTPSRPAVWQSIREGALIASLLAVPCRRHHYSLLDHAVSRGPHTVTLAAACMRARRRTV